MLRFIIRRLVLAGISFFGVTFLIWLFGVSFSQGTGIFHTDSHAVKSYGAWLLGFFRGDWGTLRTLTYTSSSIDLRTAPILPEIRNDLMPTLLLLIPAFIIQTVLSFVLGIATAMRAGPLSRIATTASFALTAAPAFLLAMVLIEYIALINQWLPAFNLYTYYDISIPYGTPEFWTYLHTHLGECARIFARHLVLPVFALVLATYPQDSQLIRVSMLDVLGQDYIRAARAHGLPRWRITWGHALRNALLPILTQVGTQVPRLLFVGAVVEFVFKLPGIGKFFCDSVVSFPAESSSGTFAAPPRDFASIVACAMIFVVLSIISTLLTDITYAWVDPRIRQGV